jgi:hypothetical protein
MSRYLKIIDNFHESLLLIIPRVQRTSGIDLNGNYPVNF